MTDDLLYARTTCSALVITCSDFRFKHVEAAFAEAAGLTDDYDLIARPGAIRSLVAPRTAAAADSMDEEILLLRRLHGFTRVLMVNHMSCRAYDDLAQDEGQRAVHLDHLRTVASSLEKRFDGLTAEAYLIALEGSALRVERAPLKA